ncbi:ABC transporter ATP-binding protein [Falsochrobactrum sp. TDYN1]|uniref:ABC transporter ATP-binding protein n=1 Tax=Falsochrobactrum tianjinense TaxID=2706015 RepID=A0A949PMX0_9HYPH|nr:ABC transporter ATP-binding protein [Falsochrobactrum sp. TDYN1]MBV2143260.1 ABC transporter ATP-binding protein [Falsochrobactrum sp. TDYN1]
MMVPLLEMADMSIQSSTGFQIADIVSGITLTLGRGERLGIVGESGSGKSITALAAMGLLPDRMRVRGTLRFDGENLMSMPEAQLCKMRGRRMAMIFQEPMTALNPIKSIGTQIAEGRRLHLGESRADSERKARSLLDRVGLPAPRFNLGLYPHQLSGGQRQRVMIAIAIACEPDLLIADEPTTALDVTVQAQILDLMDELVDETGTALMLITHDLGVVSEMTDRIAVMYAGRIVETGPTEAVFRRMAHPYTRGLFTASPLITAQSHNHSDRRQRLAAIPGVVPDPLARPPYCSFAGRCAFVQNDCRQAIPPLDMLDKNNGVVHRAACFHPRSGEMAL